MSPCLNKTLTSPSARYSSSHSLLSASPSARWSVYVILGCGVIYLTGDETHNGLCLLQSSRYSFL